MNKQILQAERMVTISYQTKLHKIIILKIYCS